MKQIRNILALVLALIFCSQMLLAQVTYQVRPGDTLYSLAKLYGVTVEAIQKANPQITGETIRAGFNLVIPDPEPADGISPTPLAPHPSSSSSTSVGEYKPQTTLTFPSFNTTGDHWTDGTLTLAVILPFNLNANTSDENKTQMRSVEFYQGVLMAVDDIQKLGRRVYVQAYDLGTQSMSSILGSPELLRADVILAPMEEAEVRQVANWGEAHGTPVVSPFVFNASMIDEYEHLFQINTQKSMLYPQLSEELISRFRDYTFVFVTDSKHASKTDPYPALLKQELTKRNITYKEFSYQSTDRLMACDSIMGLMDANILFVPVTPQQDAIRRMFNGLQHVKILRESRHQLALAEGRYHEVPELAVLGYPEWLLYTHDLVDYYYDLNVYMFSKVYVNPFDDDVKQFYSDFKYWYAKEPMSIIPKYGILGYDLAKFFLKSLTRHGAHIEERLNGELGESLQTVLSFRRDQVGKGLYNHGLYLVHFTQDSKVVKITIK